MSKSKKSKKKAPKKAPGVVIRVSDEVHEHIVSHLRGNESYDSCLRNLFHLQPKRGAERKLQHLWILPKSQVLHTNKNEALTEGTLNAIQRGDSEPEKPIKLQWWVS